MPELTAPNYTTRRAPRAMARQHTVAIVPSPFSLPPTCTAVLVSEVLEAVEAPTVSDAWWTRTNMSLTATPTYEVASEGANEVVTVINGDVAVIVFRSPVIVSPLMVHVPSTTPTSSLGITSSQPPVGVKTELWSVE
jgi:hypothetical protein